MDGRLESPDADVWIDWCNLGSILSQATIRSASPPGARVSATRPTPSISTPRRPSTEPTTPSATGSQDRAAPGRASGLTHRTKTPTPSTYQPEARTWKSPHRSARRVQPYHPDRRHRELGTFGVLLRRLAATLRRRSPRPHRHRGHGQSSSTTTSSSNRPAPRCNTHPCRNRSRPDRAIGGTINDDADTVDYSFTLSADDLLIAPWLEVEPGGSCGPYIVLRGDEPIGEGDCTLWTGAVRPWHLPHRRHRRGWPGL